MKVKLEDIIEAMEFAGMETEYYYDTQSEKVLMLFDGMVDGEDNPELFEDIKEGFVEDYIPLPGQYDINEYRIMEEFIYELPAATERTLPAAATTRRDRQTRKARPDRTSMSRIPKASIRAWSV